MCEHVHACAHTRTHTQTDSQHSDLLSLLYHLRMEGRKVCFISCECDMYDLVTSL
jgi:hypothetical protein